MEKQPRLFEKATATIAVLGALTFAGCQEDTHQVTENGVYQDGKFYYPDTDSGTRIEASCQGDTLIVKEITSATPDSTDILLDQKTCNDGMVTESDNLLPLAIIITE